MNSPRISVVMSVLNGQEYISQAIESILNQTFKDFEFIIVDDGSTDQTWNILQKYAAQDTRVTAIKVIDNIGTSRALNKALEIATGQFIARQDADDWSLPDRLDTLLAFLEEHPEVGLVATQANMVDPSGKQIEIGFPIRDNDEIQKALLDVMCLCGPSIMIRRSHFEAAGYYFANDLSFTEDYDLCLRMSEVSLLYNLHRPLYAYRQHQGSVSNKRRFRQMINKAIALERASVRRHGSNPKPELAANLARDYLRASVLGYKEGEMASAHQLLQKAMQIKPDLLNATEPLAQILQRYAPDKDPFSMIGFTNDLFSNLLPKEQKIKAIKNKIIAKYHVASAFELAKRKQQQQAFQHLSTAILKDPSWLRNRGVRSLMVKLAIHQPI